MPALAQEWNPQRRLGALGDAELVLGAELPEGPDEAPVYRLTAEPVPLTPEEALSWAERFGLSEPRVYRDPRDPDALTVIGSGGQRLEIRHAPLAGIAYSGSGFPADWQPGAQDPPSIETARETAIAFLRQCGLLPKEYRVEDQSGEVPPGVEYPPLRGLKVVPQLDGYPIKGHDVEMFLRAGPDGEVVYGWLPNALRFERAGVYPLKSAREAFEELQTGDHKGPFRLSINREFPSEPEPPVTRYTPESPDYAVGDEVTVRGQVQLLQEVGGDDIRATLSGPDGLFELNGPSLAEMTDIGFDEVEVQGMIEGKLGPRGWRLASGWRLAVENWEKAPRQQVDRFLVAVESVGERVIVRAEAGTRYRLADPPADLHQGQCLAIYAEVVPAEGDEPSILRWFSIESPPAIQGYASGSSESVSVVEKVEVEKEVIGGSSMEMMVPVQPEAGFEPPQSPYEAGEEVEIKGMVGAVIYTDGTHRKVRAWLTARLGPDYDLNYQLSGSPPLLEELAQHDRLHLRVKGRIVGEGEYPRGQTVEVESFEKIWPDETLRGYLGTISIETLEGREVAIFTDEETSQRYVISRSLTPHFTRDEYNWAQEFKQLYLEGVERPGQTFAGLPVIEVVGTRAGGSVDAVTSADQLPLEHPQVVDERTMPGRMKGKAIIDRVELTYYASPMGYVKDSPGATPTWFPSDFGLLQPVWVFHGHSEDGRATFRAYVQAVADDYLAEK